MAVASSNSLAIASPAVEITRWRLSVIPLKRLYLPLYPGSMLRGAFGHALRHSQCHCKTDVHSRNCLYAQVFEGRGQAIDAASNTTPAFVISPADTSGWVETGHAWNFTVTTITTDTAIHPDLLEAWELAFRRGIGENRVPCQLHSIDEAPLSWRPLEQKVTLKLTSPWLIKRQGRQVRADNCYLQDLLIAIAQRQRLLDQQYQIGLHPPSNDELLAIAKNTHVALSLEDTHWQRHSARQQKTHPLAGMMGSAVLTQTDPGGLSNLTRLLNFGSWLHAGGKTAFGLGGLQLQPQVGPGNLSSFPGIQHKGLS